MPDRTRASGVAREFLIIVTGVLTALALGNWNDARQVRRLEREYVAAITADIIAQKEHYRRWENELGKYQMRIDTIWSWAHGAAPRGYAPRFVVLWLRQGAQVNLNTRYPDGAYQELLNSGRLSIIRNRGLREALVEYHNGLDRMNEVVKEIGDRAVASYELATAGTIPADIAWRALPPGKVTQEDADVALAAYRRHPQALQGLVASRQSLDLRMGIALRASERGDEVLAKLNLYKRGLL